MLLGGPGSKPLHSSHSTPTTPHTPHRVSAELSAHFVVFDSIAAITRLLKPVADGWLKVLYTIHCVCVYWHIVYRL